jgi:hypothetical protein
VATHSKEALRRRDLKPAKGILKRTNSTIDVAGTADEASAKDTTSHGVLRPSMVQNRQTEKGSKRRLSRPMVGGETSSSGPYNLPYNRIVSGNKSSHNTEKFKATDVQRSVPAAQKQDSTGNESSPLIGQPQRNTKKRTLSRVGVDERQRSNKLQRVHKH